MKGFCYSVGEIEPHCMISALSSYVVTYKILSKVLNLLKRYPQFRFEDVIQGGHCDRVFAIYRRIRSLYPMPTKLTGLYWFQSVGPFVWSSVLNSGDNLVPIWHQAITWTSNDLPNGPLWTNYNAIYNDLGQDICTCCLQNASHQVRGSLCSMFYYCFNSWRAALF